MEGVGKVEWSGVEYNLNFLWFIRKKLTGANGTPYLSFDDANGISKKTIIFPPGTR
jgi:hypothetical protein